uniref:Uncharacterized protein n=1 Tax=Glossina austeni TaxID=7395 RepID=A0A1A9V9Q3_GLOAU
MCQELWIEHGQTTTTNDVLIVIADLVELLSLSLLLLSSLLITNGVTSHNYVLKNRYEHMFSEFENFIVKRMLSLTQRDFENKELDDVLGIMYGALCSGTCASVPAVSEFGPRFHLFCNYGR